MIRPCLLWFRSGCPGIMMRPFEPNEPVFVPILVADEGSGRNRMLESLNGISAVLLNYTCDKHPRTLLRTIESAQKLWLHKANQRAKSNLLCLETIQRSNLSTNCDPCGCSCAGVRSHSGGVRPGALGKGRIRMHGTRHVETPCIHRSASAFW